MTALPPIFSSQRFRSVVVLLITIAVACYTFANLSPATQSTRAITWAPPTWSLFSDGGSSLSWTQAPPESLDDWKNASLTKWLEFPEIDPPPYDIEENYEPPTGAYSGGVVWLTRRRKIRDTLASLESLARYMPMQQDYAFIFMHSGDMSDAVTQELVHDMWEVRTGEIAAADPSLAAKMRRMGKGIEFLEIDMAAPENVARQGRSGMKPVVFANAWPGYHSMCRFYAVNIFWHPRIRKLDYYMRMDSDSYILTPMHEDPFRRMQRAGTSYTFRSRGVDPDWVVTGVPDYIEKFVNKHAEEPGMEGVKRRLNESQIVELSRQHKGSFGTYYNNWELVHLASFRRPGVQKWLSTLVTNDEGFYKHRWGDAPLRYATVQMFFEPHQYEEWCDFAYHHQFTMKQGKLLSENASQSLSHSSFVG